MLLLQMLRPCLIKFRLRTQGQPLLSLLISVPFIKGVSATAVAVGGGAKAHSSNSTAYPPPTTKLDSLTTSAVSSLIPETSSSLSPISSGSASPIVGAGVRTDQQSPPPVRLIIGAIITFLALSTLIIIIALWWRNQRRSQKLKTRMRLASQDLGQPHTNRDQHSSTRGEDEHHLMTSSGFPSTSLAGPYQNTYPSTTTVQLSPPVSARQVEYGIREPTPVSSYHPSNGYAYPGLRRLSMDLGSTS
ncbi:hypothetical protein FRB95_012510 [Tulasnella sp. JGI-2019a]|nr:hypothetical protein FRB93_001564 [Tulasnella sp. JGI-2019a]KAG9034817.1 hypothetical protein FRB95_012510 [Tulasnella sp. JGI-2019a]